MATIFPRYLGTGQHVFTGQISIASGGTPLVTNGASENFNISMVAGAWSGGIITGATNGIQVGSTTAHSASLFTNNVSRVLVNSAGNVTINPPTAAPSLTLAETSGVVTTQVFGAGGGFGTAIKLLGSSAAQGRNWLIGNQFNVSNALEFTPSTANGGSTFTSPAMQITGAGNVTINTPSSGATLTVNMPNNSSATQITDGTTTMSFAMSTGHDGQFGTSTNHALDLFTNGSTRLSITNAGNVSVLAPSSGYSLTTNDSDGQGIQINSTAVNGTRLALANSGAEFGFFGSAKDIISGSLANTDAAVLSNNNLWLASGATSVPQLAVYTNGEVVITQQPAATNQSSTAFDVGYVDIPQNLQNATYATVITDRGKSIDHTAGTAHTYTINDASVNYPIGTSISFDNAGSGQVTISVQTTPANLIWCPSGSTGNRFLSQYGVATARKVASGAPGTWHLTGVGLS